MSIIIKLVTGDEFRYAPLTDNALEALAKAIRENGTLTINKNLVINVAHIVTVRESE